MDKIKSSIQKEQKVGKPIFATSVFAIKHEWTQRKQALRLYFIEANSCDEALWIWITKFIEEKPDYTVSLWYVQVIPTT